MRSISATLPVKVDLVASKKTKFPYPLVLIEWKDAQTSHGWETEMDADTLLPTVLTVGFLIRETQDAFLVSSTIGLDKTNNSRLLIPKGMVTDSRLM